MAFSSKGNWFLGPEPRRLRRPVIAAEVRTLESRTLLSGNPPTVADATYSINENLASGASVGTVVASDPDAAETLTYAITGGNTGGAFAINSSTGEITVDNAAAVDFETSPSFALTVEVTDSEAPTLSDTATITINLNNVNDPPTVSLGSNVVAIDENTSTSIQLIVTSVTVNDDALGSETLSLSGPDAAFFQIVGSTLRVKAGTKLDYEAKPTYEVTVNVNDATVGSNPDDSESFTLNLNNVLEPPVIVPNQRFQILPNSPSGTVVGTLNAFDPDGGPLQYAFINDQYAGLFQINSSTGVITVANNNQVGARGYSLTARVRDAGGQAVNEAITIIADTTTTLSGQAANQPVLDTDIISPFASLSVNDPDTHGLTLRIEIPNTFYGDFTPATVAGWTRTTTSGGARYFRAFDTAPNIGGVVTDALRSLVFQPNPDVLLDGQSVTLGFILLFPYTDINDSSVSIRITNDNEAPVIAGGAANQAVNDNATIAPFSAMTITDPDRQSMNAIVRINNGVVRGDFTAASAAGWTRTTTGNNIQYSRTFAAAEDIGSVVQAAIQGLVFQPRTNAIKPNTTEATSFTVTLFDGGAPVSDSTTSVITTSVNNAPVLGGLNATLAVNDNAIVNPLAAVTVSDVDNQEMLISVTILNGVVRGDFTNAMSSGWTVRQVIGNNITYKRYFSPSANVGAAAQAAFRELIFQPRQNAIKPNTTEATDFQVTVSDGVAPAVVGIAARVTTTSVNQAPVIEGMQNNQPVNSDQTIAPFSTVTTTDPDTQDLFVRITITTGTSHGEFTPASATGWTRKLGGNGSVDVIYERFFPATANNGAVAQAAIRALVFQPALNPGIGTQITTYFTIFVNDGLASDTEVTTVKTTGVAPRTTPAILDRDMTTVVLPNNKKTRHATLA